MIKKISNIFSVSQEFLPEFLGWLFYLFYDFSFFLEAILLFFANPGISSNSDFMVLLVLHVFLFHPKTMRFITNSFAKFFLRSDFYPNTTELDLLERKFPPNVLQFLQSYIFPYKPSNFKLFTADESWPFSTVNQNLVVKIFASSSDSL